MREYKTRCARHRFYRSQTKEATKMFKETALSYNGAYFDVFEMMINQQIATFDNRSLCFVEETERLKTLKELLVAKEKAVQIRILEEHRPDFYDAAQFKRDYKLYNERVQNAYNEFFLYISNNFQKWWD